MCNFCTYLENFALCRGVDDVELDFTGYYYQYYNVTNYHALETSYTYVHRLGTWDRPIYISIMKKAMYKQHGALYFTYSNTPQNFINTTAL